MVEEGAEPLVLSLKRIFSQALISVTLAGLTEAERNRDIAFYDETLLINVRLSIAASGKTLPPPSSRHSATAFALPIKSKVEDNGDDGDKDSSDSPPILLVLLLSSIQVLLDASYTAPRLSDSPNSIISNGFSGTNDTTTPSNHVTPASDRRDAAYQNIILQQRSNTGEISQMHSSTWNGTDIPGRHKDIDVITDVNKSDAHVAPCNGGDISFAEIKGAGMWNIDWRCKLPITFIQCRHPNPALLLTAGMTLRLQPSKLARIAPSLINNLDSGTASHLVYTHDLLNPLSEGPSYPDESPAERAARADANLAKLPLSNLPSSILGSKLVTPARNAKEVASLMAKRSLLENGDMGGAREPQGRKGDNERTLSNEGLMNFQSGGATHRDNHGRLSEDVLILQRSARKVLDVQSAIIVRMRTITVPDFDGKTGHSDSSLLPALILCVEVENPLNSGYEYALDKADVTVSTSISNFASLQEGFIFHISMVRIGEVIEPLIVKQGSQYNLLYRAEFESEVIDGNGNAALILDSFSDTLRNISIKLLGRPLISIRLESIAPIDRFISTWTCTLDLAPQMRMMALKRLVANGTGSSGLRGSNKENEKGPDKRMNLTSIMCDGDRPASPLSPSPFPRNRRDSQNASTIRPSLRLTSSAKNQSLISLNRSNASQEAAPMSPALSSSLVGQSIIARARQSRNRDENRQLLKGSPRIPTEAITAGGNHGIESTSTPKIKSAHRRTQISSISLETDLNAIFPLSDKRSVSTVQRLLINPLDEQGLLIDIVACKVEDKSDKHCWSKALIEVQVENRSDAERLLYLSWRLPSNQNSNDSSQQRHILFDEDDVQVGPLYRQDSTTAILQLYFTKPGLHSIPPLAVFEVYTGVEKILHGMQSIVV